MSVFEDLKKMVNLIILKMKIINGKFMVKLIVVITFVLKLIPLIRLKKNG